MINIGIATRLLHYMLPRAITFSAARADASRLDPCLPPGDAFCVSRGGHHRNDG